MKKNTKSIRVIGAIIAVIFVFSAMMAFTAVGTSAAIRPISQSDREALAHGTYHPHNNDPSIWFPMPDPLPSEIANLLHNNQ